jgi:formylmethanofuran dehydrogenase subunit E
MQRRHFLAMGATLLGASALNASSEKMLTCKVPIECKAWYLPPTLALSKNNLALHVRDTDSALGRYNPQGYTKTITLDELVKYHGHLCDGIVFSFLQLFVALNKLFPDGVIDRTDICGACKNSPCMVDALSYLTGARINFQTLRIDASLASAHIIQKISTGETYRVQLSDGMFSEDLKKAESSIRAKVANNETITPAEVDHVEKLADNFISMMLGTPLEKLITIQKLENYKFHANELVDAFGKRGDIVNKNLARD